MILLSIFDNTILTGAIIGGVAGLIGYLFVYLRKDQKFDRLSKTIHEQGKEYAALYHYASFKRFKKSVKFFDAIGVLYLAGDKLYFKSSEKDPPMEFNLRECSVQMEPDWRLMKWFSISTPVGEKFYFNSHKMGALKNDSSETVQGYEKIKSKIDSLART